MTKSATSWRSVVAALVVIVVLAATPAVAQASTGTHHGPGNWIEWTISQFTSIWHLVIGGQIHTDDTGQLPDPKPTGG